MLFVKYFYSKRALGSYIALIDLATHRNTEQTPVLAHCCLVRTSAV
jgi:hypothetical protein